jgi:hypothetical protein
MALQNTDLFRFGIYNILLKYLSICEYASLSPLCLACGVLGETGPQLVKLLLDSLANPNESTDVGLEYLSMVEEDWINEPVTEVFLRSTSI